MASFDFLIHGISICCCFDVDFWCPNRKGSLFVSAVYMHKWRVIPRTSQCLIIISRKNAELFMTNEEKSKFSIRLTWMRLAAVRPTWFCHKVVVWAHAAWLVFEWISIECLWIQRAQHHQHRIVSTIEWKRNKERKIYFGIYYKYVVCGYQRGFIC